MNSERRAGCHDAPGDVRTGPDCAEHIPTGVSPRGGDPALGQRREDGTGIDGSEVIDPVEVSAEQVDDPFAEVGELRTPANGEGQHGESVVGIIRT